jgi:hypothetical protein
VALGERPGTAEVFVFDGLPVGHASLGAVSTGAQRVDTCETRTLDSELEHKPGRVRLIKLDVEGSELRALAGAQEVLARHAPYLLVETNAETARAFGYSTDDLVGWLRQRAYHPFRYVKSRWVAIPAEARAPTDGNVLFVPGTSLSEFIGLASMPAPGSHGR